MESFFKGIYRKMDDVADNPIEVLDEDDVADLIID